MTVATDGWQWHPCFRFHRSWVKKHTYKRHVCVPFSVLDWCSQFWVQLSLKLWKRVAPRWQPWPLRSCRRWEMTDSRMMLAIGTVYKAAFQFLVLLFYFLIIPGVCVLWRFLRICKLLVKRWGIKCHAVHITSHCSSSWRSRNMLPESVSSAFCTSIVPLRSDWTKSSFHSHSWEGARLSSHHSEQTVQKLHCGDFQQWQVGPQ